MPDDRFAGPSVPNRAALAQPIAPDTARKAHPPIVGVDQTAVAAREGKQRHQIVSEVEIAKVRLEGEQIGSVMASLAPKGEGSLFPRACGGNHDRGRQLSPSAFPFDPADPAATAPGHRSCPPRLPGMRAGPARAIEQQEIQMLAAECPAPAFHGTRRSGHGSVEDRIAGVETDAMNRRTGGVQKRPVDAEFEQQRQRGRGNELAADLAPREGTPFDDGHAPAGPAEQKCCSRTSRAPTDDDGIIGAVCRAMEHGEPQSCD